MKVRVRRRIPGQPAPVRKVENRWTPELSESFTPISNFFLDHYADLRPRIKALEAMFIIHLMQNKWDEQAPFPGFRSLAKKMGISMSAARTYARSLQTKGYVRRQEQIGRSNLFHFDKLFAALTDLKKQQDAATKTDQADAALTTQPTTADLAV